MDLKELREENARHASEVLTALGLTPIWAVYGKGRDEYEAPGDYDPLVKSLGPDLLVQVDEDSYNGCSFLLYGTPGGQYGFLSFGWGSCSGCDALRQCESWGDVETLRKRLLGDIHWASDRLQMWLWLTDEEIQTLKWHWGSVSFAEFLKHAARQMFGVEYRDVNAPRTDAQG